MSGLDMTLDDLAAKNKQQFRRSSGNGGRGGSRGGFQGNRGRGGSQGNRGRGGRFQKSNQNKRTPYSRVNSISQLFEFINTLFSQPDGKSASDSGRWEHDQFRDDEPVREQSGNFGHKLQVSNLKFDVLEAELFVCQFF